METRVVEGTKIGLSIFSLAKALAEAGMTPLAYMLNVMRDPKVGPKRRDEKQRRTYGTANDLHSSTVGSSVCDVW